MKVVEKSKSGVFCNPTQSKSLSGEVIENPEATKSKQTQVKSNFDSKWFQYPDRYYLMDKLFLAIIFFPFTGWKLRLGWVEIVIGEISD